MINSSATLPSLKKLLETTVSGVNSDTLLDVLVTSVVITFIQKKFADQQINWNLVVKKSQSWVTKESTKFNVNVDWSSVATRYLTSINAL